MAKYENLTGKVLTTPQKNKIGYWLQSLPKEVILRAINTATTYCNEPRSVFAYLNKIIDDYIKKGYKSISQIEEAEKVFRNRCAYNESVTKPKGAFNNYNQKIYSSDEIAEILKRKQSQLQH